MPLTAKQRMFCIEYMKDSNAKQAMLRAGYSENTHHDTLMRLPEIQEQIAIQEHQAAIAASVTPHYVISSLQKIAEISSTVHEIKDQKTGEIISKKVQDAPNAIKAQELLGKSLGIYKDNINVNAVVRPAPAEVAEMTKEQIAEAFKKLA